MARKHYRQEIHGNPYGFSRMSRQEVLAVQATLGLNDNLRVPNRQFHAALDQFATQQLRDESPAMLERIDAMMVDGHKPSAEQKAIMKVQAMMGFVDPSSWGLTQSDVDTIKQMRPEEFEKFSGVVGGQIPQTELTEKQRVALSHLSLGGQATTMDTQQALKEIHDRRIIDGKFGKVTHAALGNYFEPNEAGQVAGLDAPNQQAAEQAAPAAPVATAAAPTGGLGPYNGPLPQARPTTAAPEPTLGQTVVDGAAGALNAAGDFFGGAFNGAMNLGGQGVDQIKKGAAAVADTFTPKEETKPTEPAAKQDGRVAAKPQTAQAGKTYSYKADIRHEQGGRVQPTRVNEQTPEQVGQLIGAKTRPGMEPDTVQIEVPRGVDPQAYRDQLVLGIAMGRGGSEDAFARTDANIGAVQNLKGANGATQSYITAPLGAFSTTNVQDQFKADAKAQNGVFFPAMNPALAAAQKPAAAKPTATAAKPAGQTPVGAAPAPVEVATTNGPRPYTGAMPRPRPEMTAAAQPSVAVDKPAAPQGVSALLDPAFVTATMPASVVMPTVDGAALSQTVPNGAGFVPQEPAGEVLTIPQATAPAQPQPDAAPTQPAAVASVPSAEQGWFSATTESMYAALNAINPFGGSTPAQAATTQPAQQAAQPAASAPQAQQPWTGLTPDQIPAMANLRPDAKPFGGAPNANIAAALNPANWGGSTPAQAAAVAPQTPQPVEAAPQTQPVAAAPALSVADIAANINSYGLTQNKHSDMSKALGEIADRYGRGEMEKVPLAGGLNPTEHFGGFKNRMQNQIRATQVPGQDAYLLTAATMTGGGTFDLSEKNIKAVLAKSGQDLKPGSVSGKLNGVSVGEISGDASFGEFVSLLDPRTGKLVQPEITTKGGSHIKPWYDVGRPVGMDKGKWDALNPDQRHEQGTKLPPGVTAEAWEKIGSDDAKKKILQDHRETQLAGSDKLVGYAPALSAIDPADYARFKDANFHEPVTKNGAVVVNGETYRALVAAAKDPKAMAEFLPIKKVIAELPRPAKTLEEMKADAAKRDAEAGKKAEAKPDAAKPEDDKKAQPGAAKPNDKVAASKTDLAKPKQDEPKKKSCLLGGPGCPKP